jgi:FAD/FMN-containing dehydrogenase
MNETIARRKFLTKSIAAAGGVMLGSLALSKSSTDNSRVSKAAVSGLRKQLKGRLLLPGDGDYAAARLLRNRAIDKMPLCIAQCATPSDVQRCIEFAQRHELPSAVRGGGHHMAGFATVDGGIVIDLSKMPNLAIDKKTRTATAQPGVMVAQLNLEAPQHGLVLPTGMILTIGMGGMTLGGGEGWLTSSLGLTCDNLVSAEVATADGRLLRASSSENTDLLWGLRGGGGNFGVVTELQYRLHDLEEIVAGTIVYPAANGTDIIRRWRDVVEKDQKELVSLALFVRAPEPMIIVGVCHYGSADKAEAAIAPLRVLDKPLTTNIRRMSPFDAQFIFSSQDPPPNLGIYCRSHYMQHLSEDMIRVYVDSGNRITSQYSDVWLTRYTGAFRDPSAASAAAYPHRHTPYQFGLTAQWLSDQNGDEQIAWGRQSWLNMAPLASGEIYSNFSSEPVMDGGATPYGENYARLQQLKKKFDPSNFFNRNFNITPAA